jgi:ribonuclease HI
MTEPRASVTGGCYLLNTDGGYAYEGQRRAGDPLPVAAIGALLRTRRLVPVGDPISEVIGRATHNEAEYQALIRGLTLAHEYGIKQLRVYMDSELVVDQLNCRSAVREPRLMKLHAVASSLVDSFKNIRVSWVPREMNVEADRLVRDALKTLD